MYLKIKKRKKDWKAWTIKNSLDKMLKTTRVLLGQELRI